MKRSGKLLDFPGQISIFEYLERISKDKPKEGYLEKGERLTTLARTKFERMMDRLKFTDLEKTIFSTKIPDNCYLETIVDLLCKHVVRPLVKSMTTFDEKDGLYLSLKEVIDYNITLSAGAVSYNASKYLRFHHKKTDDQLVLTIREENWPDVTLVGYRAYGLPKGKYGSRDDLIFSDRSVAADISLILSWLICLTLYNRAIADENMESEIREAFPAGELCKKEELMQSVLRTSGVRGTSFDTTVPVFTSLQKYKTPSDAFISAFERVTEATVKGQSRWPDDILPKFNKDDIATGLKPHGYLLLPDVEWYLVMCDPVEAFKQGLGRASYNRLLTRYKEDKSNAEQIPMSWVKPRLGNMNFNRVVSYVLRALWKKKGVVAKIFKYYDDLRNEGKRAKVWQTKKNIPQKMLKDMEESTLNKYFGYVEFDESCDADALKTIAAEFSAFKDRRLSLLDLSSVSIRFRLLGNYKAAGLYFPNINCLCVDVRHPSSFVHELGHSIDYLNDSLSEKVAFSKVYGAYRTALVSKENMSHEKYRALSQSRSKYNLDYYLLPTEVFARCMEMYVGRILKEEQLSICKIETEMGWAYPDDERLMHLVTEYFDCLFYSLNNTSAEDFSAA